MKNFFTCHNNGVTALVSEDVLSDIRKFNNICRNFAQREEDVEYRERWRAEMAGNATRHLTVPIFTFVRTERFMDSPWFTGNGVVFDALVRHIKQGGGTIEAECFHVPFSNGCELGMHGEESMQNELGYVTTSTQFRETFGISISDLFTSGEEIGLDPSELILEARRM